MIRFIIPLHITLALLSCRPEQVADSDNKSVMVVHSRKTNYQLTLMATQLKVPWSMDWLENGDAIVSDRKAGKLVLFHPNDTLGTDICNVPETYTFLDSGMRDVLVVNNDQAEWVYFSYDRFRDVDSTSTLVVERAILQDECLVQRELLFLAEP